MPCRLVVLGPVERCRCLILVAAPNLSTVRADLLLELLDQSGQLVLLDPLLLDQVAEPLRLGDVLLLEEALLVDVLVLHGPQLVPVLLLERSFGDLHLRDDPLHLQQLLRLVPELLLELVDHLCLL